MKHRNLFLLASIICLSAGVSAQVTNKVSVYVRSGTQVYVYENMTNTSTGDFKVDEEGLLYVDGTLINNGAMRFENASSLLRGASGNDGTGSGTYFVKRQGSVNAGVFNFWTSPMQAYSGIPGNSNYLYDPILGTQTFTDDQPADPGWVPYDGLMTPGVGYTGRSGGLATFTGDVNNGNVNAPLFYTPDVPGNTAANTPFNLVGNPYPSGISCASLVAANPDISGALYFWDDDLTGGSGYSSTDYAVWNGTGSLGTGSGSAGVPNGVISSGQGFKVKAISSGAILNFSNTMRVSNTAQFFRMNGNNSRMWFSIEGNDHFNQILIGILEDATNDEDRLYDATKIRGNGEISLAAASDGKDYCILAFPPPNAQKMIPLSVFVNESGTYTFRANAMENFEYQNVFFEDLVNNYHVPVHEGTEIQVTLDAGEYNNRFYLNFRTDGFVGLDEGEAASGVTIYSYGDVIYVSGNSTSGITTRLELFDLNGRLVFAKEKLTISSTPTLISIRGLPEAIYVVRLVVAGEVFNAKIIKQ